MVLLLPVWPLSIAGGLAFGMMGIPLVVVSATVGAALAFLVSRYLARQIVRNIAHKRPVLRAIDEAVTDEGWKVVILLRLSPLVPFNLQNYFLGATGYPTSALCPVYFHRHYAWCSSLCLSWNARPICHQHRGR